MKNQSQHSPKARSVSACGAELYEGLQKSIQALADRTKSVVGEKNYKQAQKALESAVYWVADFANIKATGSKRQRSQDILAGLTKRRKAWTNLATTVGNEAAEKAREGLEWMGEKLHIPTRKELALLNEQIRRLESRLNEVKPVAKRARPASTRTRRSPNGPTTHPPRAS